MSMLANVVCELPSKSHLPEPGGWASQGFDPRNWNPQTQGYQNWDPRNSNPRNWESQNGFRNYPVTKQHHVKPYGHEFSNWDSRDWESRHQNYMSENKVALLDSEPVHLV